MDNKQLKAIFVLLLTIALPLSFFQPWIVGVCIFLVVTIFAMIELEQKHHDDFKSLKGDIQSAQTISASQYERIEQLEKMITRLEKLEKEIAHLEPEKLKADLKTLIESNNQIVLNMRSGQAFGGMS